MSIAKLTVARNLCCFHCNKQSKFSWNSLSTIIFMCQKIVCSVEVKKHPRSERPCHPALKTAKACDNFAVLFYKAKGELCKACEHVTILTALKLLCLLKALSRLFSTICACPQSCPLWQNVLSVQRCAFSWEQPSKQLCQPSKGCGCSSS